MRLFFAIVLALAGLGFIGYGLYLIGTPIIYMSIGFILIGFAGLCGDAGR
jgi:hypothetical protein